jgi:hypothetical protein
LGLEVLAGSTGEKVTIALGSDQSNLRKSHQLRQQDQSKFGIDFDVYGKYNSIHRFAWWNCQNWSPQWNELEIMSFDQILDQEIERNWCSLDRAQLTSGIRPKN